MNRERLGQIQLPRPGGLRSSPPSAAQWTRHSRRRDLPCALSGWMAGDHHRNELGTGGARLLVHLHPRFYPHLSHRSVRKRIGRDTTSIKCAANKYYILCFLLDTSYILWYNAPVNEFAQFPLSGHGLRSVCGAIHLRTLSGLYASVSRTTVPLLGICRFTGTFYI